MIFTSVFENDSETQNRSLAEQRLRLASPRALHCEVVIIVPVVGAVVGEATRSRGERSTKGTGDGTVARSHAESMPTNTANDRN